MTIVAIGELLWDLLPDGKQLGGAPANVAQHCLGLGAESVLVSRVGRDDGGDEALGLLQERGCSLEAIQRDPAAPTGTAGVSLDASGQPGFAIPPGAAWDYLEADEAARHAVAGAGAICFGTLGQRTAPARQAIQSLLASARPGTLRILDVNWRPPFGSWELLDHSLKSADVIKLSEQELELLSGFLGLMGDPEDRLAELSRHYGLTLAALTRGSRGSLLQASGETVDHPGLPVRVRDAVGAGDAFTAALTLGLLRGDPLDEISRRANEVAAYVCTQAGATPRLPVELMRGERS
jgi:fructokinase